jgi:hypothetical protein
MLRIKERSQMKLAMSVALALTAAGLSGCTTSKPEKMGNLGNAFLRPVAAWLPPWLFSSTA